MAIIGVDDRILVPDSALTTRPFSAVVQVTAYFPNGSAYTGSGAMIGPDDLLTAGHLVYSDDDGGWATRVIATPAMGGTSAPFGSAVDENIFSVNGWVNYEDFRWDYAYVDLDENIGYQTGWFDMKSTGETGTFLESLGYPGDHGSDQMVYTSGTVDYAGFNVFKFTDDMDSYFGQSGSPVFYTDPETDRISVAGLVSHQTYWPTDTNGILRLTDAMIDQIDEWAENSIDNSTPLSFNESYYLEQNPDVAKGVEEGWLQNGYFHYFIYGWKEGRDPCDGFDTSFYLLNNPDVAAAGIEPFNHYIVSGRYEGRVPDFDPAYYLAQNPDVAESGVDPEYHYIHFGKYEGRQPAAEDSYDESDYLITTAEINPNGPPENEDSLPPADDGYADAPPYVFDRIINYSFHDGEIVGTAGNDYFDLNYGDNSIWGNGGSDVFEFNSATGNDIIFDFNPMNDFLNLNRWVELGAVSATEYPDRTVIHIRDYSQITLMGVTSDDWEYVRDVDLVTFLI